MDFFASQDRARRNTKLLVFYFLVGVALLILAVYAAVLLVFFGLGENSHQASPMALWRPQLFAGVAMATLAVIAGGSAVKMGQLSGGGSAVATMLGGELVSPGTRDPEERRVLNIVEEMAIASGIPVPQVYVLRAENGINAFVAGRSPSDAVVAVTQGTLKLLNRDELQGVIGHEFSHLLNGDMRVNLRLIGIVFGILCLAVIGRILLRTRGRKNPLPLLGLALVLIGGIGVFFGRLIQAAVSRQREYLADASAVQFTRNPEGLAGALKKIGGLNCGSQLQSPHASEASHMFFGNGVKASLFGLLDTHPPLEKRILALDPNFDGSFEQVIVPPAALRKPPTIDSKLGPRSKIPFPLPALSGSARGADAPRVPPVIPAASVVGQVGNPTPAHLRYAEQLRNAIPDAVGEAARDALGATAVMYSLLISSEEGVRGKQLELLKTSTSAQTVEETLRILPQVQALATKARLPVMDLALPALRHLSPAQFETFSLAVRQLVEGDHQIDLFEYVLQKAVLRHLEPYFVPERKKPIQYYALKPLLDDCSVLLSGLARVGADDPGQAERAFAEGAAQLTYAAQAGLSFVAAEQCALADMDRALNRLSQAVSQIKKLVLEGCARCVAADGLIHETEAELLRAIADSLDCPLPPWLPAATSEPSSPRPGAIAAPALPRRDATRR